MHPTYPFCAPRRQVAPELRAARRLHDALRRAAAAAARPTVNAFPSAAPATRAAAASSAGEALLGAHADYSDQFDPPAPPPTYHGGGGGSAGGGPRYGDSDAPWTMHASSTDPLAGQVVLGEPVAREDGAD